MDHRNAAPRSAPPTSVPDEGSTTESSPGTEAATTTAPPLRPTAGDVALLAAAQQFELTARDLYDTGLEAGAADGELAGLYVAIRESHEEYASAISALLGVEAPQRRNDALFDEHEASFDTSDAAALAASAYELESVAVATHLDLLTRLESTGGAATISSMLLVESRHCTVLADAAGKGDDLTALLDNDASPLDLAASTPDASTPDASTPGGSTPDASTPDASTPGGSTPDASTPDTSTPDTSTPEGSATTEADGAAPATTEG